VLLRNSLGKGFASLKYAGLHFQYNDLFLGYISYCRPTDICDSELQKETLIALAHKNNFPFIFKIVFSSSPRKFQCTNNTSRATL
jgi:hypothetical protein